MLSVIYFNFKYANGATNNRPIEIKVNGNSVVSSLDFDTTGSWTAWNYYDYARP